MKKVDTHILALYIAILLLIPVASYLGYKYGYKKAIRTQKETKSSVKINHVISNKINKSKEPFQKKEAVIEKKKIVSPSAQEKLYSLNCEEARQNILDFLSYLNQRDYLKKYLKGDDIKKRMAFFIKRLSQNLPSPQGEATNSDIMIKNIYHLFRVLSIEDIRMIKEIFENEADQIEYIMRWYYIWFISQEKCPDSYKIIPSLRTGYIYASFFLNTIGGRAYLFRRPNLVRLLLTYYCVIIIHEMQKKGENNYGINIQPVAKELKEELVKFPELKFQLQYINTLNKILKE